MRIWGRSGRIDEKRLYIFAGFVDYPIAKCHCCLGRAAAGMVGCGSYPRKSVRSMHGQRLQAAEKLRVDRSVLTYLR